MGGIGFAIGFEALSGFRGDADRPLATTASLLPQFGDILRHNVPVALLLMSGVVTAGISTAVGTLLTFGFVGATLSTAISVAGPSNALGSIALYAPIEILGFITAATAGLLPMTATLARARPSGAINTYRTLLSASLKFFAAAMVLLIIAAAIESIVLQIRTG